MLPMKDIFGTDIFTGPPPTPHPPPQWQALNRQSYTPILPSQRPREPRNRPSYTPPHPPPTHQHSNNLVAGIPLLTFTPSLTGIN